VKLDEGKRLIMLMNEDKIIDLDDFDAENAARAAQAAGTNTSRAAGSEGSLDENEQLVTFRLADEEYGISIMDVREIIRVPEITVVPNAPTGVQGITSLRNRVLPVMDLRTKFRFQTLLKETDAFCNKMHQFQAQHDEIARQLGEAIQNGTAKGVTGSIDRCELTHWRESFSTRDETLEQLVESLCVDDKSFHEAAESVVKLIQSAEKDKDEEGKVNTDNAQAKFATAFQGAHAKLTSQFQKLLAAIDHKEDERCLVIGIGNMDVALRVDAVNEVLQVAKDYVESTPEIVSGTGVTKDQIRGVAKLDDGKRLIMFLDVNKLASEAELRAMTAASQNKGAEISNDEGASNMDSTANSEERQLVSFKVADEEYATDIMQVQEIIRLEKVTKVPHAPSFIEGVVNLRGNVLPVIDLRRRFDLPSRDHDDSTRVIVVDINDKRTGIIVDAVSEVMRLANSNIEPAPAIVKSTYGDDFIEGVGNINNGERMLLLLRVEKLLSDEEMNSLCDVANNQSQAVVEKEPAAQVDRPEVQDAQDAQEASDGEVVSDHSEE